MLTKHVLRGILNTTKQEAQDKDNKASKEERSNGQRRDLKSSKRKSKEVQSTENVSHGKEQPKHRIPHSKRNRWQKMRRELGGSFETEPLMLYKVNPGATTENGKLSVEDEQKHYRA